MRRLLLTIAIFLPACGDPSYDSKYEATVTVSAYRYTTEQSRASSCGASIRERHPPDVFVIDGSKEEIQCYIDDGYYDSVHIDEK